MAALLMETIGPDHEKVIEEGQGNKITITTEKRIGLDCAEKLFAVCGDNASPNDTFCDHLYQQLLKDYDDDPASISGLPRCRFHG